MGKFVGKNSRVATILSLGTHKPKDAPLTLQMYPMYPSPQQELHPLKSNAFHGALLRQLRRHTVT